LLKKTKSSNPTNLFPMKTKSFMPLRLSHFSLALLLSIRYWYITLKRLEKPKYNGNTRSRSPVPSGHGSSTRLLRRSISQIKNPLHLSLPLLHSSAREALSVSQTKLHCAHPFRQDPRHPLPHRIRFLAWHRRPPKDQAQWHLAAHGGFTC
jgi:hypothetical protein